MQRPRRLIAALKMIPGLRESPYMAWAAGRAAADALHHSVTGRTYAPARLGDTFNEKPDRAKARCAGWQNVRIQCIDVGKEPVDGSFDLICMRVLESGPAFLKLDAIRRLVLGALAPAGYLVLGTHAAPPDLQERWWARRLARGARAQHDRFRCAGLGPIAEAFVCGDARVTTVLQEASQC